MQGTRMFSLHETTKSLLCRAAFVALCVVPTCSVLAWSVAVRLPAYTRAHERAIAARLGLVAHLGKASTPRPGVTLYDSLELSDPDTRQPLARLGFVEVDASGRVLAVRLASPGVVNGTRLDAFWQVAQAALRSVEKSESVLFEAQNLTVHLSAGDQTLTDVTAGIDSAGEQVRLTGSFRLAASRSKASEPATFALARHREAKSAGCVLQFSTGTAPLPCSLAGSIWPNVNRLGGASEFQGSIVAAIDDNTWKARLDGRLSRVDLDLLVSAQFPHKLTGFADAELEHVAIQNGRIETAAGVISAGPGSIGNSLVRSAHAHLHLQATEAPEGDGERPYHKFAVAFAVNAEGLMMRGEVPHAAEGALMVDEHQETILREPNLLAQPVVNLARALVPQSQVQVPATRETASLVRALPVPSIAPAADGQEQPIQARSLRVGPKRE
jgi:hypothetical protein